MRVTENSISIIVPTLNEEENIVPLVSEITPWAVPFREIPTPQTLWSGAAM
jgi:hypothetical protein